jgi:hypothetical protein
MLARCFNPNDAMYHRYGGRGIKVCDRWVGKDGFNNFIEDMGAQPKGLTLDRIDNDKGYSKENCRWVDRKIQNRNTGRNRLIEVDGVSKCLEEWAEVSPVSSHCIAKRLRRGWPAKDAVFTAESGKGVKRRRLRDLPPQEGVSKVYKRFDYETLSSNDSFIIPNPPDHVPELQGPYLQIGTREKLLFVDGVCKPFGLWMKETDVPRNVVKDRLTRGWSDKEALFTPALGVGKKRPGIRRPITPLQTTPSPNP